MRQIDFHIPDILCENCVMHLESLEDDLPGIHSARASLRQQTLSIEYDENQVDLEKIEAGIHKMGYTIG